MFKFRMPQFLHLPHQVLFFDMDDLLLLILSIFASVYLYFYVGVVVFVFMIVYMRLKHKLGRGYIFHLLFLVGLHRFKGYPIYFEKKFYD